MFYSERDWDRAANAMKLFFILVLLFTMPFIANWRGYVDGQNNERKAAVESGAARWVIDEKSGEKVFEYKAPK